MQDKHKIAHMKAAFVYAECSTAVRAKVGCVIVKDNRIISIGYNGTPSGWDNQCEKRVFFDDRGVQLLHPQLKTKREVLHAETNAIAKLARSSENGDGATAFITHGPCMDCSKIMYQSGITEVFYNIQYRDSAGVDFLRQCGIKVEQMDV